MFGSAPNTIPEDPSTTADGVGEKAVAPDDAQSSAMTADSAKNGTEASLTPKKADESGDRKRRSSSVAKAKDMFSSAKQSFHLSSSAPTSTEKGTSPLQKLTRADPALGVPQGSHNNSAGESTPTAKSTFRVGVTEDKNRKCRRTMEDTHAYLYNFLSTPAAVISNATTPSGGQADSTTSATSEEIVETDNGYFAVFDGHAGTFAADWCGKKLHIMLEDTIRKNPNTPIPELLDQTFTAADQELETLPIKNSGCTAVTAVLRWEDRVPNPASATGSTFLNQAAAKATSEPASNTGPEAVPAKLDTTAATSTPAKAAGGETKLREAATRQRVLYTANVGDARIVLCRNGRALRLSYDHKGSDENEGRRVANAGGMILNNRVNGVLAVTRALGDSYMKDLVTGHPYTTETVIQPDQDEFIILACDGLWDVCTDQEAVDLVRGITDPQAASKKLVDHALQRFSTDNLSCMLVRFDNEALKRRKTEASIGVAGDKETAPAGTSEAEAILNQTIKHQEETGELLPLPNADKLAEERLQKAGDAAGSGNGTPAGNIVDAQPAA